MGEVLRQANAIPIWLMSRVEDATRTLEERIKAMPDHFRTGLILRNLFFGESDKFTRWEQSPLRDGLITADSASEFHWDENCLREINAGVIDAVGRLPFHVALSESGEKSLLSHGQHLTLKAWLRITDEIFSQMDSFIERTEKLKAEHA